MNALEYAINMEHDGEKFYTEQAQINRNNGLKSVCLLLAQDEKNHAIIISNKLNEVPYTLLITDTLFEVKNVFKDMGDIKSEIRETPDQLEFYRIASDMERQSIDLYTDLLSKAANDGEKELFLYLIQQEEQHLEILDELVALLRHTEDWVENAEFGVWKSRGDY